MSEEYRPITSTFRRVSPSGLAIMVDRPPGRGHDWALIPRSVIHGADDLKVGGFAAGDAITIRIMAWKAEELGWAAERKPRPPAPPRPPPKGQGRLL